jgi:hypothetical protein
MLEEAVQGSEYFKRLSGQVLEPEKLFDDPSLRALEDAHDGIFGFLTFHPAVDTAVMEYLTLGSLADDSGPRLLVLFTTAKPAIFPIAVTASALSWVKIESSVLPASLFLRSVFRPRPAPPLPGLLVFEKISETCHPVYFPLDNARDAAEVASLVRAVAAMATAVGRQRTGRDGDFGKSLAIEASKCKMAFEQAGAKPLKQRLVETYRFASEHAGDIVSVVGLAV